MEEKKYKEILMEIAHCDSIEYLRRNSEKKYGLEYLEALEMAYENICALAQSAFRHNRKD